MAPSPADLAIQAARDGILCLLKQISNELELRGVKGFKGRGLLHFAAGGGHLKVCKFLVDDLGFHVNSTSAEGETPVLLAAKASGDRNLPVLRYLLDRGGDPAMPDARGPDGRGLTPLHMAAGSGNCEAVRLLLSKGAPVDPLDYHGTPLIAAAAMGHDQVMKILLDHGADPNKVVHDEVSPLTVACSAHSLKCVKLLTQAGADVNSKILHDAHVLMAAVDEGSTDIVKFLLEVGADPNIPDRLGKFPIMLAAGHGHRDLVEILFPQTKPIPLFPDWSVDGIIIAMKYLSFEPQESVEEQIAAAKSKGKEAFAKGDYVYAAHFYSMAIANNPHDATLFANRSLCWLRLREGENALSDAQHCKALSPLWAKAWYREGMALSFLKEHKGAVDAFEEALKLDPTSHDIKKALREAMESTKNAACLGEQYPQNAACVRSDYYVD